MRTPADLGWGDPRHLTSADMVRYDIGEGALLSVRNADAGAVFAELVRLLMQAGWDGPADAVLDDWGYARRLKRWAQAAGQHEATAPMDSWSDHAWGTAIDLDTIPNPMLAGRPADIWAHTNLPRTTAAIAARLGLEWGGNWSDPWDPQHFQLAMTPAETKALAAKIRTARSQPREDEEDVKPLLVKVGETIWVIAPDLSSRTRLVGPSQASELKGSGQYLDLGTGFSTAQLNEIPEAKKLAG